MQSSVVRRRTILNVSAPAPRTHKLLIGGSHLKMAACFACEYRAPFVDGSDARAADVADEVDDSIVHVHLAEVTEVVRAFEMRGGLPHRLATTQICHDTPGSGIAMLHHRPNSDLWTVINWRTSGRDNLRCTRIHLTALLVLRDSHNLSIKHAVYIKLLTSH